MSTLKITDAGINYKDAVFAGTEVQNITKFVFANVDGLLESDPISANAVVPLASVVHEENIQAISRLDDNAVVMSVAMGYEIGTFDYNWFGAIAMLADGSEKLIAVVHTKLQTKTKTVEASFGDYSVKSIVWRSNSIAESLSVNLAALPWQVGGDTFVKQTEFNSHNHDDDNAPCFITADKIAITTKDKLHVFMATADLKIPSNSGMSFDFIVDESVELSALDKCRLIAPVGKKIIMKKIKYDSIDIQVLNVRHTVYKDSNGDWKL